MLASPPPAPWRRDITGEAITYYNSRTRLSQAAHPQLKAAKELLTHMRKGNTTAQSSPGTQGTTTATTHPDSTGPQLSAPSQPSAASTLPSPAATTVAPTAGRRAVSEMLDGSSFNTQIKKPAPRVPPLSQKGPPGPPGSIPPAAAAAAAAVTAGLRKTEKLGAAAASIAVTSVEAASARPGMPGAAAAAAAAKKLTPEQPATPIFSIPVGSVAPGSRQRSPAAAVAAAVLIPAALKPGTPRVAAAAAARPANQPTPETSGTAAAPAPAARATLETAAAAAAALVLAAPDTDAAQAPTTGALEAALGRGTPEVVAVSPGASPVTAATAAATTAATATAAAAAESSQGAAGPAAGKLVSSTSLGMHAVMDGLIVLPAAPDAAPGASTTASGTAAEVPNSDAAGLATTQQNQEQGGAHTGSGSAGTDGGGAAAAETGRAVLGSAKETTAREESGTASGGEAGGSAPSAATRERDAASGEAGPRGLTTPHTTGGGAVPGEGGGRASAGERSSGVRQEHDLTPPGDDTALPSSLLPPGISSSEAVPGFTPSSRSTPHTPTPSSPLLPDSTCSDILTDSALGAAAAAAAAAAAVTTAAAAVTATATATVPGPGLYAPGRGTCLMFHRRNDSSKPYLYDFAVEVELELDRAWPSLQPGVPVSAGMLDPLAGVEDTRLLRPIPRALLQRYGVLPARVGSAADVRPLPKTMGFSAWWSEDCESGDLGLRVSGDSEVGGGLRARSATLVYDTHAGTFDVTLQDTAAEQAVVLRGLRPVHVGARLAERVTLWDVYVGAAFSFLGRRITLMHASAETVQWHNSQREVLEAAKVDVIHALQRLAPRSVPASIVCSRGTRAAGGVSLRLLAQQLQAVVDQLLVFRPSKGPPSLPQPTQPKKQKRKPTPDQDAEQGSSPAEPSVGRASGAQKQRTAASAAAAVAGGSSSVHRATHSGGANAPPAGFRPDARATEKHSKAPHSVEGQGTDGKHSQAQRPARPLSQLQRIAGQVQASKSEDQKRREEVRAAADDAGAATMLARVQQRAQFQKKTRKGQPVMSVRIDKMLSVLQGNA
ncbi:MAG: hypothetical protein WDW36_004796 [Sanguina aurantia]